MEKLELSFKKTLKVSKVSSLLRQMGNSWPNDYGFQLKIDVEWKEDIFSSGHHFECNIWKDMIYDIERQLCTYMCAHICWGSMEPGKFWKTNHLLFLAYINSVSALHFEVESVDR